MWQEPEDRTEDLGRDEAESAPVPFDAERADDQDLVGQEDAAATDAERDVLLGAAGPEGEGEEYQPPPVPVKTFVLGLAAVGAVILAVYMLYIYVINPPEPIEPPMAGTQPTTQPGPAYEGPTFADVTRDANLMVSTRLGDLAGQKRYIWEAKGGGVAFVDYDGDGWLDIYLVNAGTLVRREGVTAPGNFLLRNRGDGTFEDVTAAARVGDTGYGIGVAAGDFDNDGHVDLYITNVGPNVLYRNLGDGTFEDVTLKAGVAGNAYSVGAAFLDYDNDGHLDLFVANYVPFGPETVEPLSGLWKSWKVFRGPRGLPGVPDVLYRNNGDRTFTDVSVPSGIASISRRSLGVVAGDADGDGWPDIIVACDRQPNAYFHNLRRGTFQEVGLTSGLSYTEGGLAFGSQGVDLADLDDDERLDVVFSAMDGQPTSVYRNLGKNLWIDVTTPWGLRGPLTPFYTFGVAAFDFDSDGDQDLILANGHVYPDVGRMDPGAQYGQPNIIVYHAERGVYVPIVHSAGEGLAMRLPSRGLAVGDFNNDGHPDVLIGNVDLPPTLLMNQGQQGHGAILVRLEGVQSNRSGIGARVSVETRLKRQVVLVKSGSGFASQSDLRAHVGLGTAAVADRVTVAWPSGRVDQAVGVPAGSLVTAVEGKEMTWQPLAEAAVATRPARP